MTRLYIQPSWINATEDHDQWSGGNDQYRGDRSVDVNTFDKNGRARMEAFSDKAIEALKEKRKTSVPLRDRILPQMRRLDKLTNELIELEQEYKQGKMDIDEYSMYRAIAITRRDRAWILYCKAVGMPAELIPEMAKNEDVSPKVSGQTAFNIDDIQASSAAQSTQNDNSFLASIPDTNSLKKPLMKGLQAWKKAVQLSHKLRSFSNKAKDYYLTLKAL